MTEIIEDKDKCILELDTTLPFWEWFEGFAKFYERNYEIALMKVVLISHLNNSKYLHIPINIFCYKALKAFWINFYETTKCNRFEFICDIFH